jgi:hypothetical protein
MSLLKVKLMLSRTSLFEQGSLALDSLFSLGSVTGELGGISVEGPGLGQGGLLSFWAPLKWRSAGGSGESKTKPF